MIWNGTFSQYFIPCTCRFVGFCNKALTIPSRRAGEDNERRAAQYDTPMQAANANAVQSIGDNEPLFDDGTGTYITKDGRVFAGGVIANSDGTFSPAPAANAGVALTAQGSNSTALAADNNSSNNK
jgi:hypothetical protein